MRNSLPALLDSPGIKAEIALTVCWVVDLGWLADWDILLLDLREQKPQFKYGRLSRKAGKNE